MKILILTCSTGEGHNSVARALKEEALAHGHVVKVRNALEFRSQKADKKASHTYAFTTHYFPCIYRFVFPLGNAVEYLPGASLIALTHRKNAKALGRYLEEHHFDVIISVHLFASEMLDYLRNHAHKLLDTRLYYVHTDYGYTPFAAEARLDGDFLPNEEEKSKFEDYGLPAEKLHVTGIPVSVNFQLDQSQDDAKHLLGLESDVDYVLLSLGGISARKIIKLSQRILSQTADNVHILLILGKNKSLRAWLNKHNQIDARLHVITFTGQMALYMRASTVMVAKAGALTVTEAVHTQVPVVLVSAIVSERDNAALFASYCMALYEKHWTNVADDVQFLLESAEKRAELVHHQEVFSGKKAREQVIMLIEKEAGIHG